MKSSVTKTFRKRLNDLPASVREQSAKAYALFWGLCPMNLLQKLLDRVRVYS
jgi:uncharacterized protein YerC